MASPRLRVIVDDNSGDIQYGGGQWTLSTLVQWYQGTSNYPAFVTDTVFGSFTLAFEGTSVAFIGNIPDSRFSQFATISIDNGTTYNTSYSSAAPPAYLQWYQTPILPDGKHTINVGHLDGTAVDMFIVTVGPNTPLANKKVFVDNNDPAIQYTGNWSEDTGGFNAGTLPDGLPVGNTTQRSMTPGDSLNFQFSGTSISVYGIFSWMNIGVVSAMYTLDGSAQSLSYPVTPSSPEHLSEDGDATNFLFFEQDNLSSGVHTLNITITELKNQTYNLDYMVYSPSFSSLSTMPVLSGISANPPASGSTSTSASVATPTGITTGQAQVNTRNATPIGTIVGGVLGGLAVLMLVIILFFVARRRRQIGIKPLLGQQPLASNNGPLPMSSWPGAVHHPTASRDTISPFLEPAMASTGLASISNVKSHRMDLEHAGAPPPFSVGHSRSNTSSLDISKHNASSMASPHAARSAADDGLEYMSGMAVPPAYDALSTHRVSTMVSPVHR